MMKGSHLKRGGLLLIFILCLAFLMPGNLAWAEIDEPGNLEIVDEMLGDIAAAYADTTESWKVIGMKAYGAMLSREAEIPAIILRAASSGDTSNQMAAIIMSALGFNAHMEIPYGGGESIDLIDTITKLSADDLFLTSSKVYALLAYDSGAYDVSGALWSREAVIAAILAEQFREEDEYHGSWGGWDGEPDVDTTAMAVSALIPYADENAEVEEALEKALGYLSLQQEEDGTYNTYWEGFGTSNANSTAMVVIALASLGIDADGDAAFTKGENTLMDGLLSFRTEDNMFSYMKMGASDDYATKQGFLALAAYKGYLEANGGTAGENPYHVYQFGDLSEETAFPYLSVSLRVEGISENILPKANLALIPTLESPAPGTVFEAAQAFINTYGDGLTAEIDEENHAFSKIGTDEAGYFGGVDGWYYAVDGEIKAGDTIITGGEEIVLYYGLPNILIPQVEAKG